MNRLDPLRAAGLEITASRPGATLRGRGAVLRWLWDSGRWRLAEVEFADLEVEWDQQRAGLDLLGVDSSPKPSAERAPEVGQKSRFGLAENVAVRIADARLSWSRGDEVRVSFQGPIDAARDPQDNWRVAGHARSLAARVRDYGRVRGRAHRVEWTSKGNKAFDLVAEGAELDLALPGERRLALLGWLAWREGVDGGRELRLEANRLLHEAPDLPGALGSVEASASWRGGQLDDVLADFELEWNAEPLGAMCLDGLAGLTRDEEGVFGLAAELRGGRAEQPDAELVLRLDGMGRREGGRLELAVETRRGARLEGQGGWHDSGWKLALGGRVRPGPGLLAPLLGDQLSWGWAGLGFSEDTELQVRDLHLGGGFDESMSVLGAVRVRRLRLLHEGNDLGQVDAEARLGWLPDKGLLCEHLRLELPFATARGDALIRLAGGRPVGVLGWGWQLRLDQLSGLAPWLAPLSNFEGSGTLHAGHFAWIGGDRPALGIGAGLSGASLQALEAGWTATGLRSPRLVWRQQESGDGEREWVLDSSRVEAELVELESVDLELVRGALNWTAEELALHQFDFAALDGRFGLDPVAIPLPDGLWRAVLRFERVDLARLARLLPGFEGRMRGRIDGYLPLALEGFRLLDEYEGGLELTPGTEAWMSAESGVLFDLSHHPQAEEAAAILADYRVRELDGRLLPADDPRTLLELHFRGEGVVVPGELVLNASITNDQPEMFGSFWEWISNVGRHVEFE